MFTSFWEDLRIGARTMRKNPGFTLAAALTLALGIGANCAVFSIANALMVKPLPYKDSSRVAFILGNNTKQNRIQFGVGLPDLMDWRDQNRAFEEMAFYVPWNVNLTGIDQPERLQGYSVTPNTFSMLGVEAALGRTFLSSEGQTGSNRVVVLSYSLWLRAFGANRELVGHAIGLNGEQYTVIGVMPRTFEYPEFNFKGDLWTPLAVSPDMLAPAQRGSRVFVGVGRLKSSVTLAQAQADIDAITRRLESQYPDTNSGWGAKVVPMQQMLARPLAPALAILFFLVGIVLLIAGTNVANLLLARAVARKREIALRTVLGAGRVRLVRQLLTESLLLFLLGGGVGVLLAMAAVYLLSLKLGSIEFVANTAPALLNIGIDRTVLVFTLIISLVTGLVFGLMPAVRGSKTDLNETLKETAKTGGGSARQRLRSALVVLELAFALPLLVCVSLMIRSFLSVIHIDPGFNTRGLLTMQLALPDKTYQGEPQIVNFFKQLTQDVSAIPGVRSAAIVNSLPLSTTGEPIQFSIDDSPGATISDKTQLDLAIVSPDYFKTMGITIMKGAQFTEHDSANGQAVAIINQTLARQYFSSQDPIGKKIRLRAPDGTTPAFAIIGVAEDIKHWDLTTTTGPQAYVSFLQSPRRAMTLVVRTDNNPLAFASSVRRTIKNIDPAEAAFNVKSMDEIISSSLIILSFPLSLMAIFAVLALALAVVGVYGVASYSIRQRNREIGVRIALGAQVIDILKTVMRREMMLIIAGIGLGLLAAWAIATGLRSLLYGISALDPLSFAASTILLLVTGTLAIYIPALRATKVDPADTLRYE